MKKLLTIWLFISAAAQGQTLVEIIQNARMDENRHGVIRPSEILDELNRQPGARQANAAALERLSLHIQDTLSPSTQAEVKSQFARILLERNGAALDYFPTVDLARIPLIQQAIYLTAQSPSALPETVSANSIRFQMDGRCPKPSVSHSPAIAALHVYQTGEPIDQAVESCYARNSENLSAALNRLAESPEPLKLIFARAQRERAVSVTNYPAFLRELGTEGFGVEVFTKRTLVDFFGDTFAPPGAALRDIRLVLWIRVPLPGGDFLTVPAEHGDFGFLLTRDGKNRFAESRYFIGVPQAGQSAVSFWRPRAVKNAAWTESRLELVQGYQPQRAQEASDWLEAGAAALRAFRSIQKAYSFPGSAYGYYVCNDSVAVALAKFAELRGTTQRLSHLFPLIRVTELRKDSLVRPLEAEFARALGVTPEFLSARYPSDPQLVEDLDELKKRLEEAYPSTDKSRLKHFHEALSEFELKLW